jgi:hypothetical protein
MAIMVQFKDNTYDFVLSSELDSLIASKSSIAFRRSSGWVDISKDPIRKNVTPKRLLGRDRRFKYEEDSMQQQINLFSR